MLTFTYPYYRHLLNSLSFFLSLSPSHTITASYKCFFFSTAPKASCLLNVTQRLYIYWKQYFKHYRRWPCNEWDRHNPALTHSSKTWERGLVPTYLSPSAPSLPSAVVGTRRQGPVSRYYTSMSSLFPPCSSFSTVLNCMLILMTVLYTYPERSRWVLPWHGTTPHCPSPVEYLMTVATYLHHQNQNTNPDSDTRHSTDVWLLNFRATCQILPQLIINQANLRVTLLGMISHNFPNLKYYWILGKIYNDMLWSSVSTKIGMQFNTLSLRLFVKYLKFVRIISLTRESSRT